MTVDDGRFAGARHVERLQPVEGRALEVKQGETLRIAQVEGGQCVDFNAFNLADYKEHMSVGHSRRMGISLEEGGVLFTNPPHFRPLLFIAHLPSSAKTDLIGARCHAALFERRLGFDWHTNCQDTIAEAIRQYDLTPDDVHDSFNIFMNTRIDPERGWVFEWNSATADDHIDLVACMDALCVPVVCGSGDVTMLSNAFLRPIDVAILPPTRDSMEFVDAANGFFATEAQARASEHRMPIKSARELARNPAYEPAFRRAPIGVVDLEVPLPAGYLERLEHEADRAGISVEDCARRLMLTWAQVNASTLPARPGVGGAAMDDELRARWERGPKGGM